MSENKGQLKFGIVGCGMISGTHARAIADSETGMLTAAHSRTEANLRSFGEKFDVEPYTDYEQFLAEADIDGVVICTPTGTHLDYGKQAAEAGKHLIVEKPIEVTLERGQQLIDSCRSSNVKLAVIYQNRFIDDVQRMKFLLDSGDLGHIVMVDASVKWFRDQHYYSSADWRGTLALDGGGAVINQAVHTVDLMLWLCGEVESVQAYKGTLTHQNMEGEDNAVAVMRFRNGALGVFRASTSTIPAQNRKIEVHAEHGTATLDGGMFTVSYGGTQEFGKVVGSKESGTGAADPMEGITMDNHRKQYEQILSALLNDDQPAVSGADSLKSLAFVRALYQSAKRQEEVYLNLLEG
ncbi:MAG TPA: Gfo/Idh/MocA family oxidoreductase [Fodinibius sp.]|nr:Gfo/Idh/MocA family oxidoreductase [Fodinibius sp.]